MFICTNLALAVTNGKLVNMPHFDGKDEIMEYIKTIGVPATFFEAGFYMSNLGMFLNKVQTPFQPNRSLLCSQAIINE